MPKTVDGATLDIALAFVPQRQGNFIFASRPAEMFAMAKFAITSANRSSVVKSSVLILSLTVPRVTLAGDVSLADLSGHSIEYKSSDKSSYRYLDDERQWIGKAIRYTTLYISSKRNIFSRVKRELNGTVEVSEVVLSVGELVTGREHWNTSTGGTRTSEWKFENGALINISAGAGFATRLVINITRTKEGFACTVDGKDFKSPGVDHIISGKCSTCGTQYRPFERLHFAMDIEYCRVTEGNLLDEQ